MPRPAPEPKICVTVNYRGWIEFLKVMGPVVHPISITEKKALSMVMAGLDVVEHFGNGMTIKLTLENIRDHNRYHDTSAVQAPVEKKTGVPVTPPTSYAPKPDKKPAPAPAPEPKPEPAPIPEEVVTAPPTAIQTVPGVPVTGATEPAEETTEEETGLLAKDYVFEKFNKNGSVDETVIPWQSFSKNQRRLLRERINKLNEKSNMPKM